MYIANQGKIAKMREFVMKKVGKAHKIKLQGQINEDTFFREEIHYLKFETKGHMFKA